MTSISHTPGRAAGGAGRRTSVVDIAGTAWPVYKLEALAAAAVALVVVYALTTTAQTAVLTAAGVGLVVWWVRRAALVRHDSGRSGSDLISR